MNDPHAVSQEYANEARFMTRASVYEGSDGLDPNEVLVTMVLERAPTAVLEVGCGPGLLAHRLGGRHALAVTAVDVSERMVALARDRGVDARHADVQQLPFPDASFDVVVAAWMLYHVPELHRVTRANAIFAATKSA
jgi:ubiquinone/menaquinone biosynthesis C-methylase UbiE